MRRCSLRHSFLACTNAHVLTPTAHSLTIRCLQPPPCRPRHAARGARYLPRCNARRMMTLIAITFLCALSFAASADTWLMWVSLTFMIVALWLADLLFLDDDMVRSAPRPPHPRQPRPSPARTSIYLFRRPPSPRLPPPLPPHAVQLRSGVRELGAKERAFIRDHDVNINQNHTFLVHKITRPRLDRCRITRVGRDSRRTRRKARDVEARHR